MAVVIHGNPLQGNLTLAQLATLMEQSNQQLAHSYENANLAATTALAEIRSSLQTLTQENGALKAKLLEVEGRLTQENEVLRAKLAEVEGKHNQVHQTQATSHEPRIASLEARISNLEAGMQYVSTVLGQLKACANSSRQHIYAIYQTIWHGEGVVPNYPAVP